MYGKERAMSSSPVYFTPFGGEQGRKDLLARMVTLMERCGSTDRVPLVAAKK